VNESIQKYQEEADQVETALQKIEISDATTYALAADYLRDVKTTIREIESERVKITKPLNDAVKNANDLFKRIATKYLRAEAGLKQKIAAFQEQEKAREQKLLAEFAAGTQDREALVLASQAAPVADGVSTRTTYDWEVEDLARVPDWFWCLDEAKIGAYVRANKTAPEGIRLVEKTVVAAHARSST